jgi:hypothetical protein
VLYTNTVVRHGRAAEVEEDSRRDRREGEGGGCGGEEDYPGPLLLLRLHLERGLTRKSPIRLF